jgi:hypothetical protein
LSPWEIMNLKLDLQKESQRQFFWYQLWWFCFVIHKVVNEYEYKFQPFHAELSPEASLQQMLV